MNKITNFFKNTFVNLKPIKIVRNHPALTIGATVVTFVSAATIGSLTNSDKTSTTDAKDVVEQTSIVQEVETTTENEKTTDTTSSKTTTAPTTTSDKATTTTASKDDKVETTTKNELLSDYIKKHIDKVTLEDNNKPYIIDDKDLLSKEGFIVEENGDITNTDGFTLQSDNSFVNEDVVIDGGYYPAPDGNLYVSKEKYDNRNADINTIDSVNHDGEVVSFEPVNNNTDFNFIDETVIVDGTYYPAPDGGIYESKEKYDEFMNPDYQVEGLVKGEDGNYYISEEAAKDALVEFEEVNTEENNEVVTNNDTTTEVKEEVVTENNEETYAPVFENNVTEEESNTATKEDGSEWTDEKLYEEYIRSLEEAYAEETVILNEQTTEEVVTETVTEEVTETTEVAQGEEVANEVVTENNEETYAPIFENDVIEEESNTITKEDGSEWTDEKLYEEYINSLKELEEAYAEDTVILNEQTTEEVTTTENTTTTTTEKVEETTNKEENVVEPKKEEKKEEKVVEPKKEEKVEEKKEEKKETKQEEKIDESNNKEKDYYPAPDGSIWASEQDYLDSLECIDEMLEEPVVKTR